jgi:glycosyltransferase involved in cell wall biosynthesis
MKIYVIPHGLSNQIVSSQVIQRGLAVAKATNDSVRFVCIGKCEDENVLGVEYFDTYSAFCSSIRSRELIYTRSYLDFIFIFLVSHGKLEIVYDFRGFVAFESWLKNRSLVKFLFILFCEFLCYIFASRVYTVSNSFRRTLSRYFFIKRDIQVLPSLISSEKLFFPKIQVSRVVHFVYVGGLSKWQNLSEVISVYDYISAQIPAKLDIITMEVELAREYIKSAKSKETISVFSVNSLEGEVDLSHYHYGFLLRDNLLLNRVASPVKFLEYCGSGVIPIISNWVGDYSQLVVEKDLGYLYTGDASSLLNDLCNERNLHSKRIKIYNWAKTQTWESQFGLLI